MIPRRIAATVLVALLLAGCGDVLSSMTEHWFYGYVAAVEADEICLEDARRESPQAQRCFTLGGVDAAEVGEGDLVKVHYEPGEEHDPATHPGGRALEIVEVRPSG